MPAWPETPPHLLEPSRLSLAIQRPALVSSMSSAPRPRSRCRVLRVVTAPGGRIQASHAGRRDRSRPGRVATERVVGPPLVTAEVSQELSAAVEYSESQPV